MSRGYKFAGLLMLCLGIGAPSLFAQEGGPEGIVPMQGNAAGVVANPVADLSGMTGTAGAAGSDSVLKSNVLKPEEEKTDEEDSKKVEWGGYISAGYFGNTCGAHWNGNASTSSHNGGGFDAIYLNAYKAASVDKCGMDFGWGVDFAFGEDTRFMRTVAGWDEDWITGHDSQGNGTYGFAMPQLFGEVAINSMKFQFGHFYTPLGYEAIKTPDRYFYSRGLSFDTLPATHTGVIGTYTGMEKMEVSAGWFNGNDQGFTNEMGGSLVYAGITLKPTDHFSLRYGVTAGDFEDQITLIAGRSHSFGSVHTWVADLALSDKLNAITTVDYHSKSEIGELNTRTVLGQHLYYTANDCWKLGGRVEWERDRNLTLNEESELFSFAIGPHWSPCANDKLVFRPEIRFDHSTAPLYGKNLDKNDQLCLGIDAYCKF